MFVKNMGNISIYKHPIPYHQKKLLKENSNPYFQLFLQSQTHIIILLYEFILSFLFCGLVCLIAQIILDNTKLTPGHITTIFVIIGAILGGIGLYDVLEHSGHK